MLQKRAATKRFITIANPRTPEEQERVRILLRLALAAAQGLRRNGSGDKGEVGDVRAAE